MDNKLLNILQSKEVPIENQQIIDYLTGMLEADQRQQMESQELDDAMMQDAIEGLQAIKDKSRLERIAKEMNKTLQKKLTTQKKRHVETRKWKDQKWILLAIATVLLIVVICYIVIKTVKQ
ncbi:MAG: hypothetical protein ABIX01_21395 [Chitinophagaceae bacterium]